MKKILIILVLMLLLVACKPDSLSNNSYKVQNIRLGISRIVDNEFGVVCYDTTHGVDCLTFHEIYGDN